VVIERVSVAIKGGEQRRGKKWGWGKGKNIMVSKKFLIATWACQLKTFQSPLDCGNQKPFGHHTWVATEFG
jgi:hypothetical protein